MAKKTRVKKQDSYSVRTGTRDITAAALPGRPQQFDDSVSLVRERPEVMAAESLASEEPARLAARH